MAKKAYDRAPQVPDLSKTEQKVLGLLFRKGAMIQTTLADEMELTQQSISRVIGDLSGKGLIGQGDRLSLGKRGYPSRAIQLAPDFIWSAGVAIQSDSAALAMVDFAGGVQVERLLPLPSMTIEAVLSSAETALEEVLNASGKKRVDLAGLGVSVAGSFVGEGLGFNTSRSLDDWANVDVAKTFADRLEMAAWADNDGNAAALAESIIGVGRWANNFAYLYLSAGVGGGVILDGQPWRGRFGNAGEFAGGLPPNIYPFPNLELLRQMLARDGPVFETVQTMVANYDPAWPAINDWISRVSDSVSIIASNATAILDLEAIVFGGLTPKDLAERLISRVELFDQRRRAQLRPTAKLVPGEVQDNAAAIGAAMLPLRATYFR